MSLDRQIGAALWRQIAEALSAEICSGALPPGARFATESELSARFKVNRHTVRRAIQELTHQGLVRVEHGKGTFVQGPGIDYPLGPRTRFTEIMLSKGISPSRKVLETERIEADGRLAELLNVATGAPLVCTETLSSANGQTFAFSIHYFPEERLPGIAKHLEATRSITASLEQLGHGDYRREWTRVSAELPDARIADVLGRPQSRPILKTESLNLATDGTPLEFGVAHFSGDLCRLTVEGAPYD